MKVKIQRINRYSRSSNVELETIRYMEVDKETGTAKINGKWFRYTPMTKNKFGRLGSKKACYYIIEVISK